MSTIVRTAMILKLSTPVPRLWTNRPGGVSVDAEEYSFLDFEISGVLESPDHMARIAVQISIPNANNIATDLTTNSANRGAAVLLRQVEFAADGSIDTVHPYFDGLLGQPLWRGPWVILNCGQYFGRRGSSPVTEWSEVMTDHTPPDPSTKIPWIGGTA